MKINEEASFDKIVEILVALVKSQGAKVKELDGTLEVSNKVLFQMILDDMKQLLKEEYSAEKETK